jgi:DnaJ-class molecular chaperone
MNATPALANRETCAWCKGTGESTASGGFIVTCLVCGGKGNIRVNLPAEPCAVCSGSGRRNASGPCISCAGTGWSLAYVKG